MKKQYISIVDIILEFIRKSRESIYLIWISLRYSPALSAEVAQTYREKGRKWRHHHRRTEQQTTISDAFSNFRRSGRGSADEKPPLLPPHISSRHRRHRPPVVSDPRRGPPARDCCCWFLCTQPIWGSVCVHSSSRRQTQGTACLALEQILYSGCPTTEACPWQPSSGPSIYTYSQPRRILMLPWRFGSRTTTNTER